MSAVTAPKYCHRRPPTIPAKRTPKPIAALRSPYALPRSSGDVRRAANERWTLSVKALPIPRTMKPTARSVSVWS